MKLRKSNHAVYQTQYHLVFATKYRWKVLAPKGVDSYLKIKIRETLKYYPDWDYIEIGIDKDHIHIYMIIPPKYAVAKVVQVIKQNTSKSLREKFNFIQERYQNNEGLWSDGYFVSTVGINEETIKKYVEMQGREDLGQQQKLLL
jgi:putative transposase